MRIFDFVLAAAIWIVPITAFASPSTQPVVLTFHPIEDSTSLLRNPAMGWVLYLEPSGDLPDADAFWRQADPYVRYASILYVRLPWATLEPLQGDYAWRDNANFIALLRGARDRSLQLAFRVVTNSRDESRQATPQFVRDAGAAGYVEQGQHGRPLWSPDLTDPIFRRQLEAFVAAFAKEYDDPRRVAYIDGDGLGWWGEMHHLRVPAADHAELYNWICGVYAKNFHRVLLGTQIDSAMSDGGVLDKSIAIDRFGYVARMDSLGSFWLNRRGQGKLASLYPITPFFAESCYFGLGPGTNWSNFKEGYTSVSQVLQATMRDALKFHADTLDLRSPSDARNWVRYDMADVRRFIRLGGYRFVPTAIAYDRHFNPARGLTISVTWKNAGVGVFPNDNFRWHEKYQVAFSLIDPASNRVIAVTVDHRCDPGRWNAKPVAQSPPPLDFGHVAAGQYLLGLAIVDTTSNNTPAIRLAVKEMRQIGGWYVAGPVMASP